MSALFRINCPSCCFADPMGEVLNNHEKVPVKVAFVLAHLPHYRYGLFKELEKQVENVAFLSGGRSRDGSIASIPERSLANTLLVRNRWIRSFLWQSGVTTQLGRYKPDSVVFTGDPKYLSTWINAVIARCRGQQVLFWTIGWHRPEQGLRRIVRIAFYRLAHELLVYGRNGREIGVASGFPSKRINVVYNSCDSFAGSGDESLSPSQLPDGCRPVIGAVIRLSQNKGLREVIQSVAVLRSDFGIEADCLIVGEGPARPELEDLASKLGVKLFLPGALYSQERLKEVYEKLSVTVVPKAAGLTVLQSLSAGTPVITVSDPYQQMPEFEAIQDGVTGTLVERADGETIASAAAHWIKTLSNDTAEVEEACQRVVRDKWSAQAQAGRMIKVFRSSR